MKRKVDIILPCLDEEVTIHERITRINKVIKKISSSYDVNVVLCDNGSTDNSVKIASSLGAKVLFEKDRGYGATLINGINNSTADYIVMLDSDLSYDERDIPKFLNELDNGYDLVVGNRFLGDIEKKSMPMSHFYGSRLLTLYGNILFRTPSRDYHCGIRAFNRESINKCKLKYKGFEFASEMIVKAKAKHLRIKEIPTNLFVDGRDRKPHLKAIRDGLRHLFCLTYCKIDASIKFRYILCFMIVLLLSILTITSSYLIQGNRLNNNIDKSIEYISNNKFLNKEDDLELLNRIKNNNTKSKKNYLIESSNDIKNSYLWNGIDYVFRVVLFIIPVNNMFITILLSIVVILVLINSYKLFKLSKQISLAYILFNIVLIFVYKNISLDKIFYLLISLVFTRCMIYMLKKGFVNYGMFFAINGGISAFLSSTFLEFITLTIPLVLLVVYGISNNKDIINRRIYILLWLLFYIVMILLKIGLFSIFINNKLLIEVFKYLYNSSDIITIIKNIIKTNIYSINNLIPINMFNINWIIILLIMMYVFIISKRYYKKYSNISFIFIIPIVRSILLYDYSFNNYSILNVDYYAIILYIFIMYIIVMTDYIEIVKIKRIINK